MKLKINHASEINEWSDETIANFLSDFLNITNEDSIYKQAKEVFLSRIDKNYDEETAEAYADGYAQALQDIYNRTR